MVDVRIRADNDTARYLSRESERTGMPIARIAGAFLAEAARRKWRVRTTPAVETAPEDTA